MGFINEKNAWVLARLTMGWLFFWPFIDKLFGLGFNTCRDAKTQAVTVMCDAAWVNGGSPIFGYLTRATHGPFAGIFQAMATSDLVAWLFMLGLAGVGIALLSGAVVRLASFFGIIMVLLMFAAAYDFSHNPIIDDHIVYAAVLFGLMFSQAGRYCGLGKWWVETELVKKYPILQ